MLTSTHSLFLRKMSLKSIKLQEHYRTGQEDLVANFYRPCLQNSNLYKRAVGYFRSSVLLLIGPDLIDFAKRGGHVELICSPVLTREDYEAISEGIKNKNNVIEGALNRDIDEILRLDELLVNFKALSTLIAYNIIELKIAVRINGGGIYHEKLGIFSDEAGDSVSFKGSINETWNAWSENGNYESFDAFCSWEHGRDAKRVLDSHDYFDRLWSNSSKGVDVIDFPEVVRDKLISFAHHSIEDIEPSLIKDFHKKWYERNRGDQKQVRRSLFPHQIQAIEGWKRQDCRGILELATGSGKTFTAIAIIQEHFNNNGVALVVVPDRLLHKQWVEEIKKEIPDAIILKAGAGNQTWRVKHRLRQFTAPGSGLGKRLVLVTMQTARMQDFIKSIYGGGHLLFVADEVHEIGSFENSKALSIESGPRLGLSATPRRYGDEVGTERIFNYFGNVVEPPFTLVDAIRGGRLVEYEYFPEPIRFTAEESKAWAKATKEISLEYARSKKDKDGNTVVTPRISHMLIKRSRIAKKASSKVPLAVKIIKENYKEGESWLIYCEDQYQLQEVMLGLREDGFQPCEYHTSMSGDPGASLEWYKNFGGIMVSIRCLDQGVDIPKISHAIILASSQNPRQFIQRRGRVLRKSPGKYKAVIYDAIVMPLDLESEPEQLSLLKSELQRSIQFSCTAMNKSGSNKLIGLAIDLGIDPDEFGLLETDGIEEVGESDD